MSRRSRRRRTNDSHHSERESPHRSLTPALPRNLASLEPLRLIEDRRTYHPLEFFRPARTTHGGLAGPVTVTPKNKNKAFLAHGLAFPQPSKKIAVCVRRQQRREVLAAMKKFGKGKGGGKKRRNWHSNIGC